MSIKTLVHATYRYTCDRCHAEVDVGVDDKPVEDWVSINVYPRRYGETMTTKRDYCGDCAVATGFREPAGAGTDGIRP